MIFVHPSIGYVFDTEQPAIHSLIIENPMFLYEILGDIQRQLSGDDGKCVVSDNGKILSMNKYLELITQFVPFDLNHKMLLNKLAASIEKNALSGDNYRKTVELLSEIEAYFVDVTFDLVGDIGFNSIAIGTLAKTIGAHFQEDYDSLAEKIVDYFELVSAYEREKMFILFNLRCFVGDDEAQRFINTILQHGYHVVMIETYEHALLINEKRIIIDKDFCEIVM